MSKRYQTFREFYPYYLSGHSNRYCRLWHVAGTFFVILIFLMSILARNAWYLILMPIVGYGFAWIGHFFFEKNKPATFKYPLFSLLGDFVMFKDVLLGRVKI